MLVRMNIRIFNSWFIKIANIKLCCRFFNEYEQSPVINSLFIHNIHKIIVKISTQNYDT